MKNIDEEYKAYMDAAGSAMANERARAIAAESARAAVLATGSIEAVVWHAADDTRRNSYRVGNTAAVATEFAMRAAEAARVALRAKADAAYDAAYVAGREASAPTLANEAALYKAALWAANVGDGMPTLEHALDIFAYHVGEIMLAPDHVLVHFYGDVTGNYTFAVEGSGPASGDSAYADGRCIGNRCAARNDYTARCAPVLARIAAHNNGALETVSNV